jgi:ATP-dependent DNA helicase DinG
MNQALQAAAALPGEGWSGRVAPPDGQINPIGPIENFLVAVIEQLRARAPASRGGPTLACNATPARPPTWSASGRRRPPGPWPPSRPRCWPWPAPWRTCWTRRPTPADLRTGADRRRAARPGPSRPHDPAGLALDPEGHRGRGRRPDDPDFVDWFEATFLYGRVVDAACRRHWVDPTEPLRAAVLSPAHGVLVTSATLVDPALEDPFALAEMRTGAARLPPRPRCCAWSRRSTTPTTPRPSWSPT